ncbi:MAG TPA: hypothetical protein VN945_11190, partial [Gemmatimonadales bacterium]|nr:hypothetical protein [Gemmatimonadales bacterium]
MFGIPEWAFGVALIVMAISIGKAIAARIGPPEGPRGPRGPRGSRRHLAQVIDDLQKRVGGSEDVQSRLDALEDVQRRLADVEERLDFAERMLAKQRDAERIGPPKS